MIARRQSRAIIAGLAHRQCRVGRVFEADHRRNPWWASKTRPHSVQLKERWSLLESTEGLGCHVVRYSEPVPTSPGQPHGFGVLNHVAPLVLRVSTETGKSLNWTPWGLEDSTNPTCFPTPHSTFGFSTVVSQPSYSPLQVCARSNRSKVTRFMVARSTGSSLANVSLYGRICVSSSSF